MRVISDYLFKTAQQRPDAIALVCGGQRFTYATIARRASSLAGYMVSHGLKKGDRVAIYLENSAEAVIAIFGTLCAGGAFVVVNPVAPAERLAWILKNCEPKFLVSSRQRQETLHKALQLCGAQQPLLLLAGEQQLVDPVAPGAASIQKIFESDIPDPEVPLEPTDLAAIIYTSGSTGEPKGATFLHGNIDAAADSIAEYLDHTENDIVLSVLPLSASYGLLQILVPFLTGGRLVLEKGMGFPYDFIRRIKEEQVTGFAGNPTLFAILLKLENVRPDDISSLRYITNAAAALPVTFVPRLRGLFPSTKLYLMHGLTECLRTSYLPPAEVMVRPTSIGKGMRNVQLWIEDGESHRLGIGEIGELLVHGRTVMQGYWHAPDVTARVLMKGKSPWENTLRTGDLFRMDEDGYLHFVARMDEVIKTRGEKVSPVEVEDMLYTLDAILEARVLGVPDPVLGHAVKAEIVVKEGHTLTVHQVKAYCRKHLEDFKVPTIVEFVTAIPRTEAGKIRRRLAGVGE